MADLIAMDTAVRARLEAIPHVTTYVALVDAKPPADRAGFVLPYLVFWPSAGFGSPERALDYLPDGSLRWEIGVTAVGGDTARCLQAVRLARAALDGFTPAPGAGHLVERELGIDVQVDRDVSPPRLYLPLRFGCLAA